MSAWGYRTFENDNASDWVAELEQTKDLTSVKAAVNAVLRGPRKYLTTFACCQALAAAEVIAALHGHPAEELPTRLKSWMSEKPAPEPLLVQRAASAVDAILNDSELKEVWAETSDFAAWQASVMGLKARLA